MVLLAGTNKSPNGDRNDLIKTNGIAPSIRAIREIRGLFTAYRVLFTSTTAIVLLAMGCTSHKDLPPSAVSSAAPGISPEIPKPPSATDDHTELFAREFPAQASLIRSGKDFTTVPPGRYTPLPPNDLLGARSLKQRDDIVEVVVRRLATEPVPDIIKSRFLSFSHDHDPNQGLLQRIHQLGLPIEPVSARKESRMADGMRVDSEQGRYGEEYCIGYIQMDDEDSAEVALAETLGSGGGGIAVTYTLTRLNDQWTITKEEPGPPFERNQLDNSGSGRPASLLIGILERIVAGHPRRRCSA